MAEVLDHAGGPASPKDREDDMRPALPRWPVRAWQRCAAFGKDLLATVGGLLAAVTLGLVAVIVVESLTERTITVQPLSVPKPLSEDGLSTQVVALHLRDEMNVLTDEVRRQRGWSLNTQVMDPEELPDVVVPTVGLSAQALAGNVRAFFKIQNRLVLSGEIVSLDGLYSITLRLNGRPVFHSARGHQRSQISHMFGEAARAALQATQPDVGAAVAFDDGDLRTALSVCDSVIGRSTGSDAKYAHILKARTLAELGRTAEAIAEARSLFELYPKEPSPHNNLGYLFLKLGRLDEAIAEFRTAIAIAPRFALPHTGLGEIFSAMGRKDDAMNEFRAAVALGPTLFYPRMALADALRASGRTDEALDQYRTAASLSPNHADRHDRLGNAFRDLGQRDEAAAQYRAAITLDPNDGQAYDALGKVLRDLGDPAEAVTQFRAAVALDPKNAERHRSLADALDELGQAEEAQVQRKIAASLGDRR